MKIHFISDTQVVVEDASDFDLSETFDCGQCFRWNQISENEFEGVAFERVVKILKEKNKVVLKGTSVSSDFASIWRGYFDLDTDYNTIKSNLAKLDYNLNLACKYAPGIHILRQEPWETLCSFIISQNNNIPRIKGIVERLSSSFGCEIEHGFFSFPLSSRLANLDKSDLAPLRCGFRDEYILDAAKKVSSGEVDFEKIRSLPITEARNELMKIKGVGPKVAECTLLYGFHRLEAFPVDMWMRRALYTFFPGKDISYFGKYAGIAQQYIFHYSRMNPDLVK